MGNDTSAMESFKELPKKLRTELPYNSINLLFKYISKRD
jgi:hypothetical protein